EDPLRAERTRGEHHVPRGVRASARPGPPRAVGADLVHDAARAVGHGPHRGDRRQGQHLRPAALGEVQVVLHERVLRPDAAPRHARAALGAAAALRTGPAEVGVGDGHARLARTVPAEEHAHGRPHERVADARLARDVRHDVVGGRASGVGGHAEHAARLVVPGGELGPPVRDVRPRGVREEVVQGLVEGVGVDEAATAHAGAREDEHVAQAVDALDAVAAERGRPQERPQAPRRARELVVGEPAPGLEHRDAVALLGETERGHAPAEARPHDEHVDVGRHGCARAARRGAGRGVGGVVGHGQTVRHDRPPPGRAGPSARAAPGAVRDHGRVTSEPSPADEAGLEPVDLIRRSGTVLRIGRLALSAGTGSYRVKSHMTRAARALGLDRIAAHVTLTEITATPYRGPIFRTALTEARSVGINADRLAQLERFSATLPPGADLDAVDAELDRIARRPPLYCALLNALWAGIACAAFAFLNNGGLVECSAVLVAAALGQGVRRAMLHRGINQFGVTMLAAAVASVAYLVLVLALSALAGVEGGHEAGYVSAVLFLVPGFALVTGALDLAKL